MSPEPVRRRKSPRQYRILVVPGEEGGTTRSLNLRRSTVWVLAAGAVVAIAVATAALLIWTPVGTVVRIPNPDLERKYSAELHGMQERLQVLAEDVLLLRDYNTQLRKALGDTGPRDTVSTVRVMPSVADGAPDTTGGRRAGVAEPLPADVEAVYASAVMTGDGLQASFPLLPPVQGYLTGEFDPVRRHFGVDYAARTGSPVHAPADGTVLFAGWTFDGGNMLMISHGSGYMTVYKHMQSLLVGAHTSVRRGDVLALVGNTGNTSSGPHLHFELWRDGLPLDPKEFLLTTPGAYQERATRGG